jgi:hypothetical protein
MAGRPPPAGFEFEPSGRKGEIVERWIEGKTVSRRFPERICKKNPDADVPVAQRRKASSGGALPLAHRLAAVGSRGWRRTAAPPRAGWRSGGGWTAPSRKEAAEPSRRNLPRRDARTRR